MVRYVSGINCCERKGKIRTGQRRKAPASLMELGGIGGILPSACVMSPFVCRRMWHSPKWDCCLQLKLMLNSTDLEAVY